MGEPRRAVFVYKEGSKGNIQIGTSSKNKDNFSGVCLRAMQTHISFPIS